MNKGILKTVVGDVTNPQRDKENEIVIIVHCCNNLKIMGAGVALALKNKWGEVEFVYKNSDQDLGNVSFAIVEVENGMIKTIVANMIGQEGIGSNNNPKPVKYWALAKAMLCVKKYCQSMQASSPDSKIVIHAPKFGSDLAGGNWDFILELIREIWLENGIDVVIYEFQTTKK
jgi:hypothetical protein